MFERLEEAMHAMEGPATTPSLFAANEGMQAPVVSEAEWGARWEARTAAAGERRELEAVTANKARKHARGISSSEPGDAKVACRLLLTFAAPAKDSGRMTPIGRLLELPDSAARSVWRPCGPSIRR